MRKYIVGALFGFVLSFSLTAFADPIQTLVGKRVENEYSVVIDGKQLDKKAIAIDGVSYAPLRSLSDAKGYDIGFENKVVIISSDQIVAQPTTQQTTQPTVQTTGGTNVTFDDETIELNKKLLEANMKQIEILSKYGGYPPSAEDQVKLNDLTEIIKALQKQIDALKALVTPTP